MIYFYISPKYFDLTRLKGEMITFSLNSKFCADYFLNGAMAWCVQTYINLRSVGYPCAIVDKFPEEGIVVAAYRDLPFFFKPSKDLFFVSIREDGYYNPYANINICQNPEQCKEVKNSFFVPFWGQYGLVPRAKERYELFENAAFFGYEVNLANELQASDWVQFLNDMGINWRIVGASARDHEKVDYSNVDLSIAIRRFVTKDTFLYKPASKLINSWIAGVPAILGKESAFSTIRKNEYDYLEVDSYEKLKLAVKKLKNDKGLREKMIENGLLRAKEFSTESTIRKWIELLDDKVIPAYNRWINNPGRRFVHYVHSYIQLKQKGIRHRFSRTVADERH